MESAINYSKVFCLIVAFLSYVQLSYLYLPYSMALKSLEKLYPEFLMGLTAVAYTGAILFFLVSQGSRNPPKA